MHINKTNYLSFILLSFFVTSCMAGKTPIQAWWLNLSITPDKSIIDGQPVSNFNKNWKYATYLDLESIKKQTSISDVNELTHSKFKLTLSKDLNKNNINETIRIGSYQTNEDKTGMFLAIFEKSKLIKVFTDTTQQSFSALLENDERIYWYKCMNCSNFETIYWNGRTYVLE